MSQVRVTRHALCTQRIALADEPRDVARQFGKTQLRAALDHVREPRMRAEARHATSERRGLPAFVDRLEPMQQVLRLRQRRQRRRIEPGERARIAGTPAREFQCERREVGLEDFRRGLRRQRCMSGLGPQPITHAGSRAPGAAAALVGRGARNRHGLEAAHAAVGIEALPTLETRIDDDPHAFDGEARLGEVRRDDDFASPRRRGTQRRILCRGVEIAVQRQHLQRRIARAAGDGIATAPDFRGARQEDEHVAGIGLQRAQDDASGALLDGFGPAIDADGRRSRVVRGDVERAPLRSHGACIAEHRCHRGAIQRGRHDEQAQVVAQVALRVERQREAEVRLQVALVELVEDHAADVLERGIVLQPAREDAFGDHLDARRGTDARFESRAIADELSRLAACDLGQPTRHGACGDPARLQHDDALACAEPGLVQQRERDHRALARAGRRLEHRIAMRTQGRPQGRQRFEDRGDGQRKAQARDVPVTNAPAMCMIGPWKGTTCGCGASPCSWCSAGWPVPCCQRCRACRSSSAGSSWLRGPTTFSASAGSR